MTRQRTNTIGWIFVLIGVLALLVELGLYWLSPPLFGADHPIHAAPVLVGCVFGFVGFYMLDHGSALEAGRFLVQSAEGIIVAVRGGAKRPGDLVLGQEPAPATPQRPPLLPDPTVTEEHDG